MWQHCDCMGVDGDVQNYQCEKCAPRPYCREIEIHPQPEDPLPGCIYYLTLLREDYQQIRQGDCVYILRDDLTEEPKTKHVDKSKLDLFRVEQLWINEK